MTFRVSKCATAQNFPDFPQNLEICMRKLKIDAFKSFFTIFLFMIHKCYVLFFAIFKFFLAQNLKTKILTAHKNLLLECLMNFFIKWIAIKEKSFASG